MLITSLLGIRLTLWLGPTVAVPAPAPIAEALSAAEVTLNSEGRDGFQLTFTIGRGKEQLIEYALLGNPLLRPFTRVILQVWLGPVPQVLIDGFITRQQITPGHEPGTGTLTVTGEDLRVMMDLREFSMSYPAMRPEDRVMLILLKYVYLLGLPPVVMPMLVPDVPLLIDRIPAQASTDLAYIERLARQAGYVFQIQPTPVPMVNLAYWGPENRLPSPQSALSINMGPHTNVTSLNFNYDAHVPTTVLGLMQEKRTKAILPVITPPVSTHPPLALLPALAVQQPTVHSVFPPDAAGLDPPQALARAQALTDRASDPLTAEGELDVMRYGDILRPRQTVGVRGAGFSLDGFYYVKQVKHSIKRGEYKQKFTLTREGYGATSPVVVP